MFRPPKVVRMELNLAPMVDVMMCLIIFFLLASKLVDAQHRPVELPYAVAAREVERAELGSRVVVNVRCADRATGTAAYVVVGWDGRNVYERVLAAGEVAAYLEAEAGRARARQEDIRCVIRADRDVLYQDVEVVLRGCGLAQISQIVFSAKAGSEPEKGT